MTKCNSILVMGQCAWPALQKGTIYDKHVLKVVPFHKSGHKYFDRSGLLLQIR